MTHNVSSWFQQQAEQKTVVPVRKFILAGSDYSSRVLNWPSFSVTWDQVRPVRVSLNLSNEDGALNFFRTSPINLQNSCSLQMGFSHDEIGVLFNASSGYMAHTNAGITASARTVHTIFRPAWDSDDGLNHGIWQSRDADNAITEDSRIFKSSANILYWRSEDTDSNIFDAVVDVGDGETHHFNSGDLVKITGMYDSNHRAIYFGDTLVNCVGAMTPPTATSGGRFGFGEGYFFGGGIFDVLNIHNRVLTANEVALLNGFNEVSDSDLARSYLFNDNLSDESINNDTGVLVGSDEIYQFVYDDELIDVFNGTIDKIKMSDGTMNFTLVDKFKQLAQRVIGTSDVPVSYEGSSYLVSDLAWWICTSHGGLDATQDSSNPDIDYPSFATWAGVMSGDSVVMNARFTGARVLESLRKISRVTKTAIYQEENKIVFQRFNLANPLGTVLNGSNIKNTTIEVDAKNIINRKTVMLEYDTTSRFHQSTIIEQDSASVNSYGLFESVEKDANLWYVNSQSAINFAQRDVLIRKVPYGAINTKVPLVGMLRLLGEMIYVTDDQIGLSGDPFRIMKRAFSMDTGLVTFNGDASQVLGGFILDTSSLDGVDVLT